MSKYIRYAISFGVGFLFLLIAATILHKLPTTPGGVLNGETQIQFIDATSGMFIYVFSLIAVFASSILGRKVAGKPLTNLASWALAVLRVIGTLALISGGTSIYLFERKFLQFVQLFFPIAVIGIQVSLESVRKD